MLHRLRHNRRHLSGSLGLLLATVWLSLALAPCVAAADAGADSMHGGHHAPVEKSHDCGHCGAADEACASAAADDCAPASALLPRETGHDKQHHKLAALPQAPPSPSVLPPASVARLLSPGNDFIPQAPLTERYCRYRE